MIRNGLQGSYIPSLIVGYFGQTDNLSYNYDPNNPNRLTRVSESSSISRGFVSVNNGAATHYTYDKNGNMLTDANKNITAIEYNYLNLPQVITFTGNRIIQFIYDASGTKLRKITNNNGTITTYDYVGGVEYKNNTLERIANTEGSVVSNGSGGYEYEYVLRDHLGNSRVTFNGNPDGTVTVNNIKQINHYYPFGMNTEGNWNGAGGKNKYQYNGKELNEDFGLGWNDYGARFYDAAIGRYPVLDELAIFNMSNSPYNYVDNNPIGYKDVNGRYKFPVKYHSEYKQLLAYLRDNVLRDIIRSPLIMQGFLKYSGGNLTPEAVAKAAEWGEGPTIEIIENPGGKVGANGYYDSKRNTIYISKALADQFEKANSFDKNPALLSFYKTLLHETVHYGDYLDGNQEENFEPGERFDDDVFYGESIKIDNSWFRRPNAMQFANGQGIDKIDEAKDWFIWKSKVAKDEVRQLIPTVPGSSSRNTPPPVNPLPLPKPNPQPLPPPRA